MGPPCGAEKARFALAGIGQGDVFTTPLQMALIAEGIANGGVIMEPHVVKEIRNSDGKTVRTIEPKHWTTCMQPTTAAALTSMMVEVVERGHRQRRALIDKASRSPARPVPRRPVSRARTRTRGSSPSHPPNAPRYAVAVIVEHGGDFGSEATGGEVAAPIAEADAPEPVGRRTRE